MDGGLGKVTCVLFFTHISIQTSSLRVSVLVCVCVCVCQCVKCVFDASDTDPVLGVHNPDTLTHCYLSTEAAPFYATPTHTPTPPTLHHALITSP